MKLSRLHLTVCVIGLGAGLLHADDASCAGKSKWKAASTFKGAEVLSQGASQHKVKPLQAPAPVSEPARPRTAKEQQLDGLLVAYQAGLVTPSQYQQQRAAILAEP